MKTVTTRVEWTGPHSEATANVINTMVSKMIDSGQLVMRSSPDLDSTGAHTVVAVWVDLASANEYLSIVNTLSPVSAAIIE
jgi:hypothetical protein